MKKEPITKTVKTKTAAIKKIVEKKFSRTELELLEADTRIASLEVTREVLIPQLKYVQMESHNTAIETRSLGCKVYELRTETVPKLEERLEKKMVIIERALMVVAGVTMLLCLAVGFGYFYGG